MWRLLRLELVAVCATILAACSGGSEPKDATLQVDDYPALDRKPEDRLKPTVARFACFKNNEWKRYKSPKMMAIGGSIFNGVSSMQINWWLADWSPPAQIARALDKGKFEGKVPDWFKVPAYPHYGRDPYGKEPGQIPTFRLGLDLETVNVARIETAIRQQGRVMDAFQDYKSTDDDRNATVFNDNLAFGGAAVEDLLFGTPREYRERMGTVKRSTTFPPDNDDFWGKVTPQRTYTEILEHAPRVNGMTDAAKTAAALNTVFFSQNSSFVLNPTRDPCLEDMTALDQVILRKPKRLLVGVGSNSGLFTFLYTGQRIDDYCSDISFSFGKPPREWKRYVSIRESSRTEFLTYMSKLLDKLADEGGEVDGQGRYLGIEHVYVMGQMRPRVIANLKPGPGQGNPGPGGFYPPNQSRPKPDGTDYFAQYIVDFGPAGSRQVRGSEVKKADDLNSEINQQLRQMVEERNTRSRGPRFVFVDLEEMSNEYDYKHNRKAKRVVITDEHLPGLRRPVELDNQVLTFSPFEERLKDGTSIGQHIEKGGLFGIDNLHPTAVGYALLGQRLLKVITDKEGLDTESWRDISPEMAYARSFKTIENGREVNKDGNILRRQDRFLPAREQWLQAMFDAGAGGQRLDCWRKSGDEEW